MMIFTSYNIAFFVVTGIAIAILTALAIYLRRGRLNRTLTAVNAISAVTAAFCVIVSAFTILSLTETSNTAETNGTSVTQPLLPPAPATDIQLPTR